MQKNNLIVSGNNLRLDYKEFTCAIGMAGFSSNKKEGDNCTPLGTFPLREVWYRADKMEAPQTSLPLRVITKNDGWCDDVSHADYNKHIILPHPARHEKLWRDDGLYDVVVVIGYNDNPVVVGNGSAIFMHIAKPGYAGTEGCVALKMHDLLELLAHCGQNTQITLSEG